MVPEALDDLILLVSEVVTNCVRHAGVQPGEPIRMEVRASQALVRLAIVDGGPGFEPTLPVSEGSPGRPNGWGLVILDRLADRWGVGRDGGTRVWFEIYAESARERAARRLERWVAAEAAASEAAIS